MKNFILNIALLTMFLSEYGYTGSCSRSGGWSSGNNLQPRRTLGNRLNQGLSQKIDENAVNVIAHIVAANAVTSNPKEGLGRVAQRAIVTGAAAALTEAISENHTLRAVNYNTSLKKGLVAAAGSFIAGASVNLVSPYLPEKVGNVLSRPEVSTVLAIAATLYISSFAYTTEHL